MDINEYREYEALTQANIAAYESYRDLLSKKHVGEYALIYDGKIQDIVPTENQAMQAGDQVTRPYAVFRIVPTGQPLHDHTIRRVSVPRAPLTVAA